MIGNYLVGFGESLILNNNLGYFEYYSTLFTDGVWTRSFKKIEIIFFS